LLVVISIASSVGAWSCATHEKICGGIGLSNLDCCLADSSKTPAMTFHHCEGNAVDCAARVKAQAFLLEGRREIAAHLFADAYSPVHWVSFNESSCHSKFESAVNKLASNPSFNVSVDCVLKNGSRFLFVVNESYLRGVEFAVAASLNESVTASNESVVVSNGSGDGFFLLVGFPSSESSSRDWLVIVFLALFFLGALIVLFKVFGS
jgi:hypothetical protein